MSSGAPMPSSFDDDADFYEESRWQKFKRRLIEEPLIPLGCGLTCAALYGATKSIRAGDSNRANLMFRRRIYAQGFTLLALVVGSVYWQKDRDKRKEFEGLVSEKKRQEKREAWIRELEVRDTEDREVRARMEKRLDRIRDRESRASSTNSVGGSSANASTEEENQSILQKAEEQAKKAFGKGGDSKSMLEASESRGVLAAVRDLGWSR